MSHLKFSERTRRILKAVEISKGNVTESNGNGRRRQHVVQARVKPLQEKNSSLRLPQYAYMPWDELESTLKKGYEDWELGTKKRTIDSVLKEYEPLQTKRWKAGKNIINVPPSPLKLSEQLPQSSLEEQLLPHTPEQQMSQSASALSEQLLSPSTEYQLPSPSPQSVIVNTVMSPSTEYQLPSPSPQPVIVNTVMSPSTEYQLPSPSPQPVIVNTVTKSLSAPLFSSPSSDLINSLSAGESVTLIIPVTPNLNNYQIISSESPSTSSMTLRPESPKSRKRLFDHVFPDNNLGTREKKKKRCDRRNCCVYCDSVLTNLTRHMTRQHAKEKEVAEYLALLESCPKESKDRRMVIMEGLRIKGNYSHNCRELKHSSGERKADCLLPLKRPAITKEKTTRDFITCTLCQALLVKKSFFKHAQFCLAKETDKDYQIDSQLNLPNDPIAESTEFPIKNTNFVKTYGLEIRPQSEKASKLMKDTIFPILHKDRYGLTAINDDLIVATCCDYLQSHTDPKDKTIVTRKMRDASKLLFAVRDKCPNVVSLKDIFHTSTIDGVIKAVQELCICSEDGEVGVVGMPARVSWVIFECGKRLMDDILSSNTISDEDKKKRKSEVKNFLDIVRRRWKYYISTNAERSRTEKKMLKEKIIPPSEDVKKFGMHLQNPSNTFYTNLQEKRSSEAYIQLCKVTIAQIITLNARRPLEAAKIKLNFFLLRPKGASVNPNLLSELTEEERKSYDYLSEFYVPGKNGQDCSVLLTKEMERNLELIVNCRESLNIPKSNKYLFARPGLTSTFDGSAVMRELREFADLSRPKFMTANGIRHHHATMGTLRGREFTSNLSNHMSHTLDVHNKNYCYPLDIVNRGRVGNFLLGLQGVNPSDSPAGSQEGNRINNVSQSTVTSATANTSKETELDDRSDRNNDDEDWLPGNNIVEVPKKSRKRWSDAEKRIVVSEFTEFLRQKINPGPTKCKALIKTNSILSTRTPCQVNTFIDNINKGKLKLSTDLKDLIENNLC